MHRVAAEAQAALEENQRLDRLYAGGPWHAVVDAANNLLRRVLSDPDSITADEAEALIQLTEAGRHWGIATYGRDRFAEQRARRLKLFRRIAKIARDKNAQFPGTSAPHVGPRPTCGTWQTDGKVGESHAVSATANRRRLIGTNIRAARAAVELSQRQLADLVGVSRTRIADYEGGRHEPNAQHLLAIAAVTARPGGWFYDEHPEPEDEADQ